ncbi:MAG: hypothetical protein ABIT08_12980 [Bacteroidia bacterium]
MNLKASGFLYILSVVFYNQSLVAQNVEKIIQLDSITVEATKRGFDVKDFIDWVQHDTTFYKAFKNLHYYPFKIRSEMTVYSKSKEEKGTMQRNAVQYVVNRKRWMVIEDEKVSGTIYKKKKEYNYYTVELLDHIFFRLDTVTASNSIHDKADAENTDSKNGNYTEKLKTLMFNPGAEVGGVPLIGNKMAIFNEDMTKHYEYKILADTFNDSLPCYVFSCKAKQLDSIRTDGKAVIKNLETWFDKRTLNVVARKSTLAYRSIFFDFDVKMDVKLEEINGALVPVFINYNGFWDIPFRKPEIVEFKIWFSDFDISN